jgi:hypothetical protein|nr:MAG TPA: ASCH domain protein [Caudoviricetes sp.]
MAIKPILFNTEMVRAILDGQKTCTRRVVKTRRKDACGFYVTKRPDGSFTGVYEYDEDERMFENQLIQYKPGDILYVRETWCGLPVNEAGHFRGHPIYYYKADGDLRPEGWRGAWRPSIHMPKEAARIWLKVTDVRVERLQDITLEQIYREGAEVEEPFVLNGEEKRYAFSVLWNSTIKKSDLDRYGWAANPWVWVIEYERCEKPEEVRS